jgi:excisionase family DNA binding protein
VDTGDRLLTPGEVAALFRVDPKTVTRWAAAGRIGSIRTPGGHRRFRESEVRALLEGEGALEEGEERGERPEERQRDLGPQQDGSAGPGQNEGPRSTGFGAH